MVETKKLEDPLTVYGLEPSSWKLDRCSMSLRPRNTLRLLVASSPRRLIELSANCLHS